MAYLPDKVIDHLREAVALPDFSATRYELLGEIGRGGMGTVYSGRDKQLDRRVALKVLNILDPGGQAAERMAEEARVLARLEHPGIVPVHDLGTLPDGRIFYAMKLVDGTRLDAYAQDHRHSQRAAPRVLAHLRNRGIRTFPRHHPSRHQAREHYGRAVRRGTRARLGGRQDRGHRTGTFIGRFRRAATPPAAR